MANKNSAAWRRTRRDRRRATRVVVPPQYAPATTAQETASSNNTPVKGQSFHSFGFVLSASRALRGKGYHTVDDIVGLTDAELLGLPGFGPKSLALLRSKIPQSVAV